MLIRNFFRYLIIAIFLFVAGEYIFLNYILAPYLSEKIPSVAAKEGLKVSIGNIYFYPVYPAVDLSDIVLRNSENSEILNIHHISVVYSILALMRKKIVIHHLIIRKGKIHLPMDENYNLIGFPHFKKKSPGGKTVSLKIGDLLIENLRFEINVKNGFSTSLNIKALTFNLRRKKGKFYAGESFFSEGPLKIEILKGSALLSKKGQTIRTSDGLFVLKKPEGFLNYTLSIKNLESPEIRIKFKLNSSLRFLNEQLFPYPSIDGRAEIRGTITAGGTKPFLLRGVIRKSTGILEGAKFTITSSRFSITSSGLKIASLNISYAGGQLKGFYSLNFSTLFSTTRMEVAGLNFHLLPWTEKILKGKGDGKISLTGTYSPLKLAFKIKNFRGTIFYLNNGANTEIPGEGSFNAEGVILADHIEISQFIWQGEEKLLLTDFSLKYDDLASSGNLSMENLSLKKLSSLFLTRLSGKSTGKISWKINPGERVITGKIGIRNFRSPFLSADLLNGPFNLRDNILRLAVRVRKGKGEAFAGGFINILSPKKFSNIQISMKNFPAEAIQISRKYKILGKLDGEIKLSGSFPGHTLMGKLSFNGKIWGNHASLNLNLSGEKGKFLVNNTILRMGKNKLTLRGLIGEDGSINMKAFAYISNLPYTHGNMVKIHEGEITLKIEGDITNPQMITHGRFFKICVKNICIHQPDIYTSLTDMNLFVIFFNRFVSVGGAVYISKNRWIAGIHIKRKDWSRDLGTEEFVNLFSGIKGRLKGTLTPFSITGGETLLKEVVISRENFSLKGNIRLDVAGENIIIASGELKGTGGELYIDSRINLFRQINFDISGYLDLFYAASIFPQISSAGGFLAFDLGIKGPWGDVSPSGKLEFINSKLTLSDFPQPVLLNGDIDVTENRIILSGIKVSSGNGTGLLRGEIPVKDFRPAGYNLFFDFQDMEITAFEGIDITAGGELSLTGSPENALLGGNVEIIRGLVTRKINIQEEILRKKRNIAPYEENESLHLNIKTFSKGGFLIRNNLADMEIKFDLILQGTPDRMKIVGSVDLLKGSIIFRERKFFLETGIINFKGLYPPDPFVDARFNAEIEDLKDNYTYRIYLTAQGPVSNIRVLLESQPPLSETDIISLIVFGVKTSALITPATGKQTGVVETGNLIFSHQLGTLEGKMEELMGFDVISISPSFSDVSKHSTFKLKLTKRLSPKLGVTFSTSDYQELEINYIISQNIRLGVGWDNKLGSFPGNFSVSPHFYYEFNW